MNTDTNTNNFVNNFGEIGRSGEIGEMNKDTNTNDFVNDFVNNFGEIGRSGCSKAIRVVFVNDFVNDTNVFVHDFVNTKVNKQSVSFALSKNRK